MGNGTNDAQFPLIRFSTSFSHIGVAGRTTPKNYEHRTDEYVVQGATGDLVPVHSGQVGGGGEVPGGTLCVHVICTAHTVQKLRCGGVSRIFIADKTTSFDC